MSEMAASPVDTSLERENQASGATTATFPFVAALALWLGAFGSFLLLPALSRRLLDGAVPMWQVVLRSLVPPRSEEHTSELQSRFDLVCPLLLTPPALHDALPIFTGGHLPRAGEPGQRCDHRDLPLRGGARAVAGGLRQLPAAAGAVPSPAGRGGADVAGGAALPGAA